MSIETLVRQIIGKMSQISKWQKEFMIHLFTLLMVYRGRHNFENLSRYGHHSEVTYRSWYGREFDFMTFNRHLIDTLGDEERIIAFDPTYLSKSGRHTPGVGHFWSGCAGSAKYGLETGGFASIGLESRTAMHLCAYQTIGQQKHETLLDFYVHQLSERKEHLLKVSQILVVDAYFSRKPFVEGVLANDFCMVSKLAKNAVLKYPHLGPHPKRRGRKTKYAGKVDVLDPSEEHFTACLQDEDMIAYEGKVYVNAFDRMVKCVLVHTRRKDGSLKAEVFFSTDVTMDGAKVLEYYRLRFQIEFLYRDAKQHTGLSQCQARSKQKIHTHINASLTAVSLAKAVHHLALPKQQREVFSLASIRMRYFNENYLHRIFTDFGIDPELHKNSRRYQKLFEYGCIAA
jgi:hypothetical protein